MNDIIILYVAYFQSQRMIIIIIIDLVEPSLVS